jgi:protein-tyrosine-phosphatase
MANILFVCLGNINRSPVAATVYKFYAPDDEVRSRGFVRPGRPAARKTRKWLTAHGYPHALDTHRSTLITREDMEWADIVYYPDLAIRRRLVIEWPEHGAKCQPIDPRRRIADPGFMATASPEYESTMRHVLSATQRLLAPEER